MCSQGHYGFDCSLSFTMKWVQDMTHYSSTLRYDGSPVGKFYSGCLNCAPSCVMPSPSLITATLFYDPKWVAQLAYLADVFNILNELNLSIQGGFASVLEVSDKIKGFRGETENWSMRVLNGFTDTFPQITEFLDTNKLSVELVKNQICCHFTALNEHYNSCFTDVDTDAWDWVRDPFVAHPSARGFSAKAEEKLLELSSDGTVKVHM